MRESSRKTRQRLVFLVFCTRTCSTRNMIYSLLSRRRQWTNLSHCPTFFSKVFFTAREKCYQNPQLCESSSQRSVRQKHLDSHEKYASDTALTSIPFYFLRMRSCHSYRLQGRWRFFPLWHQRNALSVWRSVCLSDVWKTAKDEKHFSANNWDHWVEYIGYFPQTEYYILPHDRHSEI